MSTHRKIQTFPFNLSNESKTHIFFPVLCQNLYHGSLEFHKDSLVYGGLFKTGLCTGFQTVTERLQSVHGLLQGPQVWMRTACLSHRDGRDSSWVSLHMALHPSASTRHFCPWRDAKPLLSRGRYYKGRLIQPYCRCHFSIYLKCR